jgi:hypothetical protein
VKTGKQTKFTGYLASFPAQNLFCMLHYEITKNFCYTSERKKPMRLNVCAEKIHWIAVNLINTDQNLATGLSRAGIILRRR